eukprot:3460296-Rhodomonas_salina.4
MALPRTADENSTHKAHPFLLSSLSRQNRGKETTPRRGSSCRSWSVRHPSLAMAASNQDSPGTSLPMRKLTFTAPSLSTHIPLFAAEAQPSFY